MCLGNDLEEMGCNDTVNQVGTEVNRVRSRGGNLAGMKFGSHMPNFVFPFHEETFIATRSRMVTVIKQFIKLISAVLSLSPEEREIGKWLGSPEIAFDRLKTSQTCLVIGRVCFV